MSLLRAAAVLALLTATTACGDEAPASDSSIAVPDELVVTVTGGASTTLPPAVVGCRESELDPGAQVLTVIVGEPGGDGSGFFATVPEADLDLPLEIELPSTVYGDDGVSSSEQTVFAFAPDQENSGSEEGSTGTVEILEAGCDVGAPVRIRVDATLASEFSDGVPLDVTGGIVTEAVDLDAYIGERYGE